MTRLLRCLAPAMIASLVSFVGNAAAQVPSGGAIVVRVQGEVFDSLRMQPLGGATVWSETAGRTAVADSQGRFVIDDVPVGTHVFAAADPSLDALGLRVTKRMEITTGGITDAVYLAVPGLQTLARRLCRTTEPLPAGTGVVYGMVRSAASGNHLAGATVDVGWLRVSGERGVMPHVTSASLSTDSLGGYAICGVPQDTILRIAAHAGAEGESGEASALLDDRRVLRLDLAVVPPRSDLRGGLIGIVVDTAGRALGGMNVLVDGTSIETRTTEDGVFALRQVPVGTRTLIARRPGMTAQYVAVPVTARDTPFVRIEMSGARLLTAVQVRAERLSRVLEEVNERRIKGAGGHHFTADELQRSSTYTGLFSMVPGLEVVRSRRPFDFQLLSRRETSIEGGRCGLHVWIDGFRANIQMLDAIRTDQLIAMEVYPRGAQLPPRFQSADGCGAVLAWTKRFVDWDG